MTLSAPHHACPTIRSSVRLLISNLVRNLATPTTLWATCCDDYNLSKMAVKHLFVQPPFCGATNQSFLQCITTSPLVKSMR